MLKAPEKWSYTFLNNFDNCPRKAWHMYVAKDLPRVETAQMKWGNYVHKALEHRLTPHIQKPLPDDCKAYEPFAAAFDGKQPRAEWWMAVTKDWLSTTLPGDTWGQGKADVVLVGDDTILLFDWKTGKPREDPFELEVFGALAQAQACWSHAKQVYGWYIWLGEMRVGKRHDLSDTGRTRARIAEMWNAVTVLDPEKEWLPTPNPLCGWCPVRSCEFNKARE